MKTVTAAIPGLDLWEVRNPWVYSQCLGVRKKIQMNCSQNRNRLTDLEKKFTRRGRVVRGIDLEFGIDTCKDLL